MSNVKEEAKKIINNLSDETTWDDIMYHMYVKKKIDIAEKEITEGKVMDHKTVKERLLNR